MNVFVRFIFAIANGFIWWLSMYPIYAYDLPLLGGVIYALLTTLLMWATWKSHPVSPLITYTLSDCTVLQGVGILLGQALGSVGGIYAMEKLWPIDLDMLFSRLAERHPVPWPFILFGVVIYSFVFIMSRESDISDRDRPFSIETSTRRGVVLAAFMFPFLPGTFNLATPLLWQRTWGFSFFQACFSSIIFHVCILLTTVLIRAVVRVVKGENAIEE
jgi:hypothetical protein